MRNQKIDCRRPAFQFSRQGILERLLDNDFIPDFRWIASPVPLGFTHVTGHAHFYAGIYALYLIAPFNRPGNIILNRPGVVIPSSVRLIADLYIFNIVWPRINPVIYLLTQPGEISGRRRTISSAP